MTVEHIQIHGAALEGNLEGNAVDRDVFVFLPPSYAKDKHRRYPVVYALHGFFIGAEQWSHEIHVPQTIEGAFAQGAQRDDRRAAGLEDPAQRLDLLELGDGGRLRELHSRATWWRTSMRTTARSPKRESRGLVGHSMGGYGATRIGMKHADVFGSLYIMSPCCLSARPAAPPTPRRTRRSEAAKHARRLRQTTVLRARAVRDARPRGRRIPNNPPFYLDLPTEGRRAAAGRARQVGGQRAAGVPRPVRRQPAPLSRHLASTSATRTGCGPTRPSCTTRWTTYGIADSFEQYSGTHTSRVADRFQNHVLPFFSKHLCFAETCRSTDQH